MFAEITYRPSEFLSALMSSQDRPEPGKATDGEKIDILIDLNSLFLYGFLKMGAIVGNSELFFLGNLLELHRSGETS